MKKIFKLLNNRLITTALLIIVQLAWMALMVVKLAEYFPLVNAIFMALSVFMMLFLINKDENPAYKIGWLTIVGLLPLFGGLMYLMFGNKRPSRGNRLRIAAVQDKLRPLMVQDEQVMEELRTVHSRQAGTAQYLMRQGPFPVCRHTETRYYPVGEDMFADMLPDLERAEHFIFLEYFIIAPGKMWDSILEILKRKAAAGVEVRVIYDDVGCLQLLPRDFDRQMEKLGIRCLAFNRFVPLVSMAMNNRDHRKILAIDGHIAYSGGLNLADEYINELPRFGHWKDTGFRLQGEAAWNLTALFLEMWNAFRPTDGSFERFQPHAYHPAGFAGSGYVQPYGDSPLDGEAMGESVYLELLAQAERYVYIYTPYLAVSHEMNMALSLAAKRGVDVRIITPGIPDKPLIYRLTRSHYRPLLEAGVRIYEYTPGFLHAKSYVSDDALGVIGSINMDFRSLYLHFECGAVFYGTNVIPALLKDMEDTLEKSREVMLRDCRQGLFGTLIDAVLRVFAPLL